MSQSSSHDSNGYIRVRFAPSPTGFLHIGNLRTGLFNWLYAKGKKGSFLIRVEDTDTARSEQKYVDDILSTMDWLGIEADEPIYYQMQRTDRYQARVEELLENGHAYKCYCTEAELEKMREIAIKEGKKPRYDRTCRELKDGEPNFARAREGKPFVIRLKTPLKGEIEFEDLVRGKITVNNDELDDFVLVRSNGVPTYNFTVVVDDVEMKLTHIIRGDDHINNTPKQIHLYKFFNFPIPYFAHMPMILGPDKKKLSKRHGDHSVNHYRGEGYLPEAVLNYIVRLGWSHGDQEVFSVDEMIEYFDFDHVSKSAAVFNVEKFLWLNGEHIRKADPARLRKIVVTDFSDHFTSDSLMRLQSPIGVQLAALIQPKIKLMREMAEQLVPLCTPGGVEVDQSGLKWNKKPELKPIIQSAVQAILEMWDTAADKNGPVDRPGDGAAWGDAPSLGDMGLDANEIDAQLRSLAEQRGIKLGDLAQPLRLFVTGRMVSASLFEVLAILPWDLASLRLRRILEA